MNLNTIAIIPAKGHSGRLPGKNIRDFHGKPILAYSIETAISSGLFDKVYVSTDHAATEQIARRHGAEALHRDAWFTMDCYGPLDVAAGILVDFGRLNYHPRFCCVIYATAPLMTAQDLMVGRQSLSEFHRYAISVSADHSHPLQDAAMFIWCRSEALIRGEPLYKQHTALVPIDGARVRDINTQDDWDNAELMYADLHAEVA